jgi:hypothetical protein
MPLPRPSSPRSAAHDPSPTPPYRAAIKAYAADRHPFFTPVLLPPWQGRTQRPTSPPSDPVAMPLSFLSSPSCCRTPRPSPKLTSAAPDPLGEPHHHPSCLATCPHHPCARAVERVTPRPPTKPRRPCHRTHGHRAVTAPCGRAQHRLAWAGWAAVLLG